MGFIHDKLDIKFLILYLMARVAGPVDFTTLADLTFCDDGVEYFDFAESVAELVSTGHLAVEGDLYTITDKGRRALEAWQQVGRQIDRQMLQGFTDEEVKQLAEYLERLRVNLQPQE